MQHLYTALLTATFASAVAAAATTVAAAATTARVAAAAATARVAAADATARDAAVTSAVTALQLSLLLLLNVLLLLLPLLLLLLSLLSYRAAQQLLHAATNYCSAPPQTVLWSTVQRTIQPLPAFSTTSACQRNSTALATRAASRLYTSLH
eukprot:15102-Heterococcus_DN1.PRE.3